MAVETISSEMDAGDIEEGYISDSEAFRSVTEALDRVAKAPNMIIQSDRDQYYTLVSIVDPTKKMNKEDEDLLLTLLKALSMGACKLNPAYHYVLLSNIFALSMWNYRLDVRNALLDLIISLVDAHDNILEGCLLMLVGNFQPPKRLQTSTSTSLQSRKKEIHSQLHMALQCIADLVPSAPMKLASVIDRRMPRETELKGAIFPFVEGILGLENKKLGEYIGSTLWAKVVNLLTELDVNIYCEDIPQEDTNKGIFEMELEDMDDMSESIGNTVTEYAEVHGVLKGNPFAEKLEGLMVMVFEHLKKCAYDGRLVEVFETLMACFRHTLLNAYKSEFAQFVMFYACSLDPEICGLKFVVMLTDMFLSETEDPISRMSAVAYLASYLSRARFISTSLVAGILGRLISWCFEYCQVHNVRKKAINPKAHRLFYSGCQAVMYILCFRMRSMTDIPELKRQLLHMPLESILFHQLKPLEVCNYHVVEEFLKQAHAAHMFKVPERFLSGNLQESKFSQAFGGVNRLDVFFPFDPCRLKESARRYIRPNYECWSLVKTTYSNCNSEEEDDDEYQDFDAPEFGNNAGSSEEYSDEDADINNDDDDELDYSLNKMSITPKPSLKHHLTRKPARTKPSDSSM